MRRELNEMEKIDRYLNGEMLPKEAMIFEAEMANDTVLKSQVEAQKMLIQSIRRKALSKTIEQVAVQQSRGGHLKWLLPLFVLIVGGVTFLFWPKPIEQNEVAKVESEPQKGHEGGFVFKLDTSGEYAINEPIDVAIDEPVSVEVTRTIERESEAPDKEQPKPDEVQEVGKHEDLMVEQNASIKDTVIQEVDIQMSDQVETDLVLNQPARFPGGKPALRAHIESFLIQARSRKKEGVIYIDFVIESDGSIHDVQVIEGVSRKMNAQAVKMVESMPNWEPAIKDGVPVSTPYRLPIILARR